MGPYHAYIFTWPQSEQLHKQLMHQYPRKLNEILRGAKKDQRTPETMSALMDTQQACGTYHMYSPKQVFRALLADPISFNQEVRLDVMYLEAKEGNKYTPVLHMFDGGTNVQSAVFLK